MRAENYKLDIMMDGEVIACFNFSNVELEFSQMKDGKYVKTITIKGRPRHTLHTRDQGEITMLDSEYKFDELDQMHKGKVSVSTQGRVSISTHV
jgi:hypothetical protein